MAVGQNTTVSANMTIKSGRLTSGAGTTHTLGTLSIGANTLSVAQGPNVTGTAGLAFGAVTQTGAAVYDMGAGTLLTLASLNNGGFTSTFQDSGSATVTGPATGSGTIIMNGTNSHSLSLNGVNSYSGGLSHHRREALPGRYHRQQHQLGSRERLRRRHTRLRPQQRVPRKPGSAISPSTAVFSRVRTMEALADLLGERYIYLGANGGTINMNGGAGQLLMYGSTIYGSATSTLTVIGPGAELDFYDGSRWVTGGTTRSGNWWSWARAARPLTTPTSISATVTSPVGATC